ncbi:hypothetical protein GOP47_0001380 [Adiantum capillus-veneris]|uniref:Uncharacterized protein n=1 Tax=Adiantum capillus-veneris TaxID=13818 RepID=A0A9D4ZPY8_ADICA|nr:hypothetical protein GOP47_0001380 [Adiantum capillus-veneris]
MMSGSRRINCRRAGCNLQVAIAQGKRMKGNLRLQEASSRSTVERRSREVDEELNVQRVVLLIPPARVAAAAGRDSSIKLKLQ